MQTIRVLTGEPYDVVVGENLLSTLGGRLAALPGKRYGKAVVVCDDNVRALYGNTVLTSLVEAGLEAAIFEFPNGESSKTMATVLAMLDMFTKNRLTRSDVVVALGGGVTGDMAGFAAAIYQRGIDYVQVPTTLLAAVDSSVGGKTAVNLPSGKNLAGAFHQPRLVLCDIKTLDTLDDDIYADGLAEAVKHGCIRDPALFELLETRDPRHSAAEIITRSVELKAAVVSTDEMELGLRRILNFGHTLGHGIEKLSGWQMSHGKAVAAGMCLMVSACAGRGILPKADANRVFALLERLGLPTESGFPLADICRESLGDKKRDGDTISLITLERIGKAGIYPVKADALADFFISGELV